MKLMDMKKTYGVSKVLMRFFFAFLCGFTFHVAFFVYDIPYATVWTYTICLLILYKLLDMFEEYNITKPIAVSYFENHKNSLSCSVSSS